MAMLGYDDEMEDRGGSDGGDLECSMLSLVARRRPPPPASHPDPRLRSSGSARGPKCARVAPRLAPARPHRPATKRVRPLLGLDLVLGRMNTTVPLNGFHRSQKAFCKPPLLPLNARWCGAVCAAAASHAALRAGLPRDSRVQPFSNQPILYPMQCNAFPCNSSRESHFNLRPYERAK